MVNLHVGAVLAVEAVEGVVVAEEEEEEEAVVAVAVAGMSKEIEHGKIRTRRAEETMTVRGGTTRRCLGPVARASPLVWFGELVVVFHYAITQFQRLEGQR